MMVVKRMLIGCGCVAALGFGCEDSSVTGSSGGAGNGASSSGGSAGSGGAGTGGLEGGTGGSGDGGEAGSGGGPIDCASLTTKGACHKVLSSPDTICFWADVYTVAEDACDLGEPTPNCFEIMNGDTGEGCADCSGVDDGRYLFKELPTGGYEILFFDECSGALGFQSLGWTRCDDMTVVPAACPCLCLP